MRFIQATIGFAGVCVLLLGSAAGVFADGMEEQPAGVQQLKTGTRQPKEPGKQKTSAVKAKSASSPAEAKRPSGNTAPLSDFELGRYQYCGQDNDCIVAVNGCCDCANGGVETAVNKERLEEFRKRFDCLYVECGHALANPPCANGVVSCLNHKCKYFDDVQR